MLITNHAAIRFLERVLGINESISKERIAYLKKLIKEAVTGKALDGFKYYTKLKGYDGFYAVIIDCRVITIIPENEVPQLDNVSRQESKRKYIPTKVDYYDSGKKKRVKKHGFKVKDTK
jgi:small nuclear ribonucleoprotein (snRNP)-like protein